MLVYSSMLHLMDRDPRPIVRAALRTWLEGKIGRKLNDEQLRQGKHAISKDHLLEVEEFDYIEGDPPSHRRAEHDWSTAFRYSHPDKEVHGRRWLTEVGLSVWSGTKSYATIRLQTEEQSALAHAPIATTRPRVTDLLVSSCKLHRNTPGGKPREIRRDDVDAFISLVHERQRRHPLLLLRCCEDGSFPINPTRVADLCVGVAEVAVVSTLSAGRAFPKRLGEILPEPGSLHILWPVVDGQWTGSVAKTRMLAEHFDEMVRQNQDPAGGVLARVCHETNAKVAGWHVDLASVQTLRLQFELRHAREKIQASATPEQMELLAMYEHCENEDKLKIRALEKELDATRDLAVAERAARGEAEEDSKQARFKAAALERALQDAKSASPREGKDRSPVRAALERILNKKPSLDDALVVLDHLFVERLIVLDTAWASARDAASFQYGDRAFALLWKLCSSYFDAVCSGDGDKQAIQVFGNNSFAARESETVENNKKARSLRTFTYKGEPIEMMRHLKIGVKPSDATTFRAHFHWDAEDNRIVLGHCGGHLDHD